MYLSEILIIYKSRQYNKQHASQDYSETHPRQQVIFHKYLILLKNNDLKITVTYYIPFIY